MKSTILIALAFVAVAAAAPTSPPVEIVSLQNEQQPDGSFTWGYVSSDGSSQQQVGELKQALDEDNKPRVVVIFNGFYSYTNDKGEEEKITYTADENGYKAFGASIPKPVEARR